MRSITCWTLSRYISWCIAVQDRRAQFFDPSVRLVRDFGLFRGVGPVHGVRILWSDDLGGCCGRVVGLASNFCAKRPGAAGRGRRAERLGAAVGLGPRCGSKLPAATPMCHGPEQKGSRGCVQRHRQCGGGGQRVPGALSAGYPGDVCDGVWLLPGETGHLPHACSSGQTGTLC